MKIDRAIVQEVVETLAWCEADTSDPVLSAKASEMRIYLAGLLNSSQED